MINVAFALKNKVDTTIIMPIKDSDEFRKECSKFRIFYKIIPINRLTKKEPWGLIKYIFLFIYEIYLIYKYLKKKILI